MDVNERNEFQDFVTQSTGLTLPLFGFNLFRGVPSTFAPVDRIPVTPDYVIGPGDQILVRAWGQIDINFAATVDRNGQISIPKVGVVNVAGLRFQELPGFLKTAIGRIYRNFELNVTMGDLRSIQIFVVGQAARPGTYTVSSLSTLVNAIFASGGPSPKGSMRRIQLKRDNRTVTEFDMYDLLVQGDKSKDVQLLPGDVIFVPPAGPLAALAGSVNIQAIFELKDRATFEDLIRLAGGFTTTAQGQKALVDRIFQRKVRRVEEFTLDQSGLAKPLQDGDVITVASITPRFENAVRLQGNVAGPARYPWKPGLRVTDLLVDENALITTAYWERQNVGTQIGRAQQPEVNFDFAVMQRLDKKDLITRLYAFNLGKAIAGDARDNLLLEPGDIVTVYAYGDTLPATENDISLNATPIGGVPRRFVWREGMRLKDVIPDAKWLADYFDFWISWERRNEAAAAGGRYVRRELNYDYATVRRFDRNTLESKLYAFALGKAMKGDSTENIELKARDAITIYGYDDPVPKTENDVLLQGSVLGLPPRRFPWREGMRLRDLIPSAQWLIEYYDYWLRVGAPGTRAEINWDFANITRLQPSDLTRTILPISLGKAILEGDPAHNVALRAGDEITLFARSEIQARQRIDTLLVRLEGEFNHAGVYQAQPGETLRQLVVRVGGITPQAYLFGSVFARESTRKIQEERLKKAIDQLEQDVQRAAATRAQSALSPEDAASLKTELETQRALVTRLRALRPDGRIVLEMPEDARIPDIPDIALENGDRFFVPPTPSMVSVFGAVFGESAFLHKPGKSVSDYLEQAGGTRREADDGSIFLVRADGSVRSRRQSGLFFGSLAGVKVMPGDAIVVPEELDRTTITRNLKDWTQILYQFGLGVAAIKILRD